MGCPSPLHGEGRGFKSLTVQSPKAVAHLKASVALDNSAAGAFLLVPLSRGMFAKVSPIDYARVSAFKWSALQQKHTCYAHKRHEGKWIMLHRYIMGAKKGDIVDHVNSDGLDCTRENLRFCNWGQNTANSRRSPNVKTPYRGVFFHKGLYRARIRHDGKNYYLRGYKTAEEAGRVYDAKALELFGPFARLNFPSTASIERTPATNATDTTAGEGTHLSEINLGGAL